MAGNGFGATRGQAGGGAELEKESLPSGPPRGPQGPPGHRLYGGTCRSCVSLQLPEQTYDLIYLHPGEGQVQTQDNPVHACCRSECLGPAPLGPPPFPDLFFSLTFRPGVTGQSSRRSPALPWPSRNCDPPFLPASPPGPSPPAWTPPGNNPEPGADGLRVNCEGL